MGDRTMQYKPVASTVADPPGAQVAGPQQGRLTQLQVTLDAAPAVQRLRQKPNRTGLPDHVKGGIESLSGLSMDHVRVNYNSPKPAALHAHAYAQGSDIHLAPGQDHHVAHEAWHIVQQAQGRVAPTMQMKGVGINDDDGLEREADRMGARAAQLKSVGHGAGCGCPGCGGTAARPAVATTAPAQRVVQRTCDDGHPYHDAGRCPFTLGEKPRAPREGGMLSQRSAPDDPQEGLNLLAFESTQQLDQRGRYAPNTVPIGLGPTPVVSYAPPRKSSDHTKPFAKKTGGEKSATQYARSLGEGQDGGKYEILHGMGYSQGGTQTNQPNNLAAASHGANTAMMPQDDAITGNTDVLVDNTHHLRPGTQFAERIEQKFIHRDFPDDPFFHEVHDGHRPPPTKSESKARSEYAKRFKKPNLDAAVGLLKMKHSNLGKRDRDEDEPEPDFMPDWKNTKNNNHPPDDDDDDQGGGLMT